MLQAPRDRFNAAAQYQPMLREIGLDAEAVFTHPGVVVWRSIPERENGTLDAELADGRKVRLHVKRYQPARGTGTPADDEAQGIRALQVEGIPTVPLVGWGRLADGRSFVITEDLAGYAAADKLVEAGTPFESLLAPTADLAAKLHAAGLHHRDLYLCHFFARFPGGNTAENMTSGGAGGPDLRLIDAARVRRLPGWPTRRRWVVKDLAQFWYSTLALPVSDEQRARWLARYAERRGLASERQRRGLRRSVEAKAGRIARHDRNLRQAQPNRNVSIPTVP